MDNKKVRKFLMKHKGWIYFLRGHKELRPDGMTEEEFNLLYETMIFESLRLTRKEYVLKPT